jgi:hypothetical protein
MSFEAFDSLGFWRDPDAIAAVAHTALTPVYITVHNPPCFPVIASLFHRPDLIVDNARRNDSESCTAQPFSRSKR